jgi:hypothetical protein
MKTEMCLQVTCCGNGQIFLEPLVALYFVINQKQK